MRKTKTYPAENCGEAYHVGEYLNNELKARKMTKTEFADKSGLSLSTVSGILNKKIDITDIIAHKIEKALGIEANLWIGLQEEYETTKARLKAEKSIEKLKELYHKD